MKTMLSKVLSLTQIAIATVALTVTSVSSQTAVEVGQNTSNQAPIEVNGQSDGSRKSDNGCGFIGQTPNLVLKVNDPLNYMRISVADAQGEPTLLVVGNNQTFCVLYDKLSSVNPEMSGFWQPDTYKIYVGNLQPGAHSFKIAIAQQK